MKTTLTGTVKTWSLGGKTRKFTEVTLPYQEACQLFVSVPFDALKNRGEQRAIHEPHVRKLRKAMECGDYTPTPSSVGLSKKHREAVKYETQPAGAVTFSLEIGSDSPLPLTDGGHRMKAISELLGEANEKLKKVKNQKEKEGLQQRVDELNLLPITITLYLDGDTRHDFVNLQAGRVLDASHLFSLRVLQKGEENPALKRAFKVAEQLHKRDGSPFQNVIRFDSRGVLAMPVKTLCSPGTSDLATSLVGLAKVAGGEPEKLAECVIAVYKALVAKSPDLLTTGKVLTPICEQGSKGSATMLIGLATCLAHRAALRGTACTDESLLAELVNAAQETLDESVSGGFSGPQKRQFMGHFAEKFFAKDSAAKHEGLPISLLKTLSPSAFGVSPLPKPEPSSKVAPADSPVVKDLVA